MAKGASRPQTRGRREPSGRVAVGSVSLMILAGCSGGGGMPGDGDAAFDVRVAEALEEARSKGASEAQMSILERASGDGGVTFEDAKAAAIATISCMADQGVDATYQDDAMPNGVTIPAYAVSALKDDGSPADPVMEQCENSESYWVNMLYQMQPSSIEANLAFIEKQAPVVGKCLEDAGYDTDPDATGMELVLQADDVARQTSGSVDCALDAGIMGY